VQLAEPLATGRDADPRFPDVALRALTVPIAGIQAVQVMRADCAAVQAFMLAAEVDGVGLYPRIVLDAKPEWRYFIAVVSLLALHSK
jgi:hypothetical protein